MSISRRSFIKGMGIGCVGCTVGSLPPGALALNPVTSLKGQSKLTPSLCEMCSYRCPIEAQVVNNKTVFIQGNRNSPHQKTRVCARGGSGVSLIYDPKRIVKPMKRKGPRVPENGKLLAGNKLIQKLPKRWQASNNIMVLKVSFSHQNQVLFPLIYFI